jgi:hypothetical protein
MFSIIISSNILIDYNNHINKPSLASVAISGDYNDLINKTWINNGNNIYNNNIGFVGIGTNNPLYPLDINGSLNTNEVFIKETNISNIIDNNILNTNLQCFMKNLREK